MSFIIIWLLFFLIEILIRKEVSGSPLWSVTDISDINTGEQMAQFMRQNALLVKTHFSWRV
ncbi:hypothetical protein V461_05935 [Pantoea ananatis BRT98]|nr:hypothetical protein V461_05935 [Pantoea ananatis BRT98]